MLQVSFTTNMDELPRIVFLEFYRSIRPRSDQGRASCMDIETNQSEETVNMNYIYKAIAVT